MLDFATKVLTAKGTCLFSVGQAGFIIKSESGQLLGIDLYLSNCVERVEGNTGFKRLLPQILNPSDLNFDAIICTHPHLDHFDIDAVPEMVSHGAKLFCSTDCEKLVKQTQMENYYKVRITYVVPGNKITAGDFKLSFVNCDHGSSAPDEETFDWVTDVNYKAAFFCCQSAVKYMRMNGGGSIVLTGSAHAWGGQKDRAAYAMTKGVLRILNEHIAHQYASEHIRCNYLTLGWTPTEGEVSLRLSQGESEAELRKRAGEVLPMGRMCERSDYMEGLVYLMSDESSMMTGSTFRLTAGEYI